MCRYMPTQCSTHAFTTVKRMCTMRFTVVKACTCIAYALHVQMQCIACIKCSALHFITTVAHMLHTVRLHMHMQSTYMYCSTACAVHYCCAASTLHVYNADTACAAMCTASSMLHCSSVFTVYAAAVYCLQCIFTTRAATN